MRVDPMGLINVQIIHALNRQGFYDGCSEFPNNFTLYKLFFLEDMLDMLTYIGFTGLIQLYHLLLCQPNGLIRQFYF